ncbi:XdhC family protein [Pseudomonas sp. ERMR1:02]|uniref:XdhC family protein n=1 Tax=unclassified Pseudomonas TaxID=196821 RepID=UPI0035314D00
MQHLDLQVVRRALEWSSAGQRVWLCTVLATYGSAPRAPGSLLAVNTEGSGSVRCPAAAWKRTSSNASPKVRLNKRSASCATARATTRARGSACPVAACSMCWWRRLSLIAKCRRICANWSRRCWADAG